MDIKEFQTKSSLLWKNSDILDIKNSNLKSLLCSMFHEQTCSWFTIFDGHTAVVLESFHGIRKLGTEGNFQKGLSLLHHA